MSTSGPITFVVPVTKSGEILENNFLASPCLKDRRRDQLLIQENFPSASTAFNEAIGQSRNDLMVFVHQDVWLPEPWLAQLERALDQLKVVDPNWGVLGCWGASPGEGCRGFIYSNGLGILGSPFVQPVPVQTLDEIVLILRKSSGLRFDERLPSFHLHGSDICLAAARKAMTSYVIPAFCVHNNNPYAALPKEFYECCRVLKQKWKAELPIETPCVKITRFNAPLRLRRLKEAYFRHIGRRKHEVSRAQNVPSLLREVALLLGKSAAN